MTKVAKYDGSHSFPATLPLAACDDSNMVAFESGFFDSSCYLFLSCTGLHMFPLPAFALCLRLS